MTTTTSPGGCSRAGPSSARGRRGGHRAAPARPRPRLRGARARGPGRAGRRGRQGRGLDRGLRQEVGARGRRALRRRPAVLAARAGRPADALRLPLRRGGRADRQRRHAGHHVADARDLPAVRGRRAARSAAGHCRRPGHAAPGAQHAAHRRRHARPPAPGPAPRSAAPARQPRAQSSSSRRRPASSIGNRSSFCRSMAAPTSPANRGCGRVGRERSSGWAWVAT